LGGGGDRHELGSGRRDAASRHPGGGNRRSRSAVANPES
jgi:hypothetical protein